MNEDERGRILRMVAEGKVTPEEGADLLEAVGSANRADRGDRADRGERAERGNQSTSWSPFNSGPPSISGRHTRRGRHLVIHVREGGESKVNVRIPLSLARTAGKFIPRQAQSYFGKYDINLQEFLDGAAEAEGGTLLEVKDGDSKVLISVE